MRRGDDGDAPHNAGAITAAVAAPRSRCLIAATLPMPPLPPLPSPLPMPPMPPPSL
jgi:hypothetical protein